MLNGLNAFLMLNIPQSADNKEVMNTLFAHPDKASIQPGSTVVNKLPPCADGITVIKV